MEKILADFSKLPLGQKLGGLALAMLLVGVGGYYVFIDSNMTKVTNMQKQLDRQEGQLIKLQQQAQHRSQFKKEVERLNQRLREAEEQLPKKAEIPKLLRDISYEAQQSGLRISEFAVSSENIKGDFAAVPVEMSVRGSYHEIAVFFDRLAKMSRIVNVSDLEMSKPEFENKKIMLTSKFTATTYRFLDKAALAAREEAEGGKKKKAPKRGK